MSIVQIFNLIFTQPIFNGLMILYHLFGDFGLSIVVLTLIIKLLLFPLTVKQLKSMKAMQKLQPAMNEIRQKYKNDQQAQMQAMQALYKEHGVSPLAGCLPMLVQLPVLYGLFFALESGLGKASDTAQQILHTVNGQLYSFVTPFTTPPVTELKWFTFINPAWHISLAQPDPTHILPILAGLATFVQLRMSQARQAGNAPTNDPTAQSMKMMQYIMPLVTVFIGWNFAAGLALYWTVSYIFQAVQQYFVTGWGSLTMLPSFNQEPASGTNNKKNTTRIVEGSATTNKAAGNGSKNGKTASQSRSSTLSTSESEETAEDETEQLTSKNTNENRIRNTTRGSGPSQYNRHRQRGSSASARRRNSSTRSRS